MSEASAKKKYLVLLQPEEKYPVLFFSYLYLIMEIIAIAKKLNRVFVLPYVHSQPRNWKLCEEGETDNEKLILGKRIDPMETFFDVEILNQYIPTVSFEEFLKHSRGTVSDLALFGTDHQSPIESYGKSLQFEKTHRIRSMQDLEKIGGVYLGITGYERGKFLVRNSPNWHDDPNQDYWGIRKHLVYNETLLREAENFINANLPKEYLAVHWRRGDRLLPEMNGQFDELIKDETDMKNAMQQFLIKPVLKKMRRYNLQTVFLATTSGTPWHIEYVKKYLPIVQYPPAKNWEDILWQSLIEQIVCMRATFYISSPHRYTYCSAFSRWIIEDRMLSGKAGMISYLKKIRGPRSVIEHIKDVLRPIKRFCSTVLSRYGTLLFR